MRRTSTAFEPSPLSWCSGEPTRAFTGSSEGTHSPGANNPRRVRFRPPSRHLRRTLRCLSQPTQCETLRSGQGDAAPPLNPQLPAPLPGQRAVGAAVANRVAGALPADRLTVMAAARTPPARSRRLTMARRRTWTAPARAIERERSRLARLHRARPDTARTLGEHAHSRADLLLSLNLRIRPTPFPPIDSRRLGIRPELSGGPRAPVSAVPRRLSDSTGGRSWPSSSRRVRTAP